MIMPPMAENNNSGQRIWNDLTYGTLSSDGRNVYSIEDDASDAGSIAVQGFPGPALIRQGVVIRGQIANFRLGPFGGEDYPAPEQSALGPRDSHRQADLGAGRAFDRALAAAAGHVLPRAPVAADGVPLCAGGTEGGGAPAGARPGDRRSVVVATIERGRAESRARPAAPPHGRLAVLRRRNPGLPHQHRALVGVDLANHSLLWAHCYVAGNNRGMRPPWVFMRANDEGGDGTAGWADSGVCIAGDRVLATPRDSDALLCLSLSDGHRLWKCPQRDDLYLACATGEAAVLVGRTAVRAVRLADGRPAWRAQRGLPRRQHAQRPRLPQRKPLLRSPRFRGSGGRRSGRGPNRGRGQIAAAARAGQPGGLPGKDHFPRFGRRRGLLPGRRRCAEIQQRLAAKPDDPEALAMQGEMLLDNGEQPAAIAALRRSYELEPVPRTRELLRDALLDGLRTQFAAYRGRLSEIEPLLENASQQAAVLRLTAEGLRRSGEPVAAFDDCEKLIALEPDRQPLDEVDHNYFVRRDRWVQGQLTDLCRQAKGEAAATIDRAPARSAGSGDGCRGHRAAAKMPGLFRRRPGGPPGTGRVGPALEPRRADGGRGVGRLARAAARRDGPARKPARRRAEAPSEPEIAAMRGISPPSPAEAVPSWPAGKVEITTGHTRTPGRSENDYAVLELRCRPLPALPGQRNRVPSQRPGDRGLRRAGKSAMAGLLGRACAGTGAQRRSRRGARLPPGPLAAALAGSESRRPRHVRRGRRVRPVSCPAQAWPGISGNPFAAGGKSPRAARAQDVLQMAVPTDGGPRGGAFALPAASREQWAGGTDPPRCSAAPACATPASARWSRSTR